MKPNCDLSNKSYKVVLTSKSVDSILQMKAIELHFPMVLFIMLCKLLFWLLTLWMKHSS